MPGDAEDDDEAPSALPMGEVGLPASELRPPTPPPPLPPSAPLPLMRGDRERDVREARGAGTAAPPGMCGPGLATAVARCEDTRSDAVDRPPWDATVGDRAPARGLVALAPRAPMDRGLVAPPPLATGVRGPRDAALADDATARLPDPCGPVVPPPRLLLLPAAAAAMVAWTGEARAAEAGLAGCGARPPGDGALVPPPSIVVVAAAMTSRCDLTVANNMRR